MSSISLKKDISSRNVFESNRKSIFFDTVKLLKRKADDRALILFFDDLQWADETTLNLFEYIADRLKDEPVLIIGTYRPGDVSSSHPLSKIKKSMSRKDIFQKITLEPLNSEEIKELAIDLADKENLSDDILYALEEKTVGNPLLINETIYQMLQNDMTKQKDDEIISNLYDIEPPKTIQEVIENRVFRVDDKGKELLQVGSAIGQEIPFEVLVKSTEKEELELLNIIEDLIDSKILKEHPSKDSFVFTHKQFADVIYQGTGKWLERKKLHQDVVEALEEIYDDSEEKYLVFAHHHEKAENFKKSYNYYFKAGKNSEKIYAHEDAIEIYEKALRIFPKIEEACRTKKDILKIIFRIAKAGTLLGRFEKSREYLLKASRITEDTVEKQRIYRMIAKTFHHQGDWNKTIDFIDKGLEIHDKENTETCRLLSRKGWIYLRKGDYERAEEVFKCEKKVAENIGDKNELSNVYHDLGTNNLWKDKLAKSIDQLSKSIKLKKEMKEENELRNTYNNLGLAYYQKGNFEEAKKFFKKSQQLYEDVGDKRNLATCLNNLGMIKLKKGKLKYASEFYYKSLKLYNELDDKHGKIIAHANLAEVLVKTGDLDECEYHLQKSYEVEEETEDKLTVAMNLLIESRLKEKRGKMDEAEEKARESLDLSKEIGNQRNQSSSHQQIGKVLSLKGEFEEGMKHLKIARNIGEEIEAEDICPMNHADIGLIELLKRNLESSEHEFKEGLKLAKETDDEEIILRNTLGLCLVKLKKEDIEEGKEYLKMISENIKNREEPEFHIQYHLLKGSFESENHLRRAVQMLENIDMKWLKEDLSENFLSSSK